MPTLPFSHEQFLAVFADYNRAIWPAQPVAAVIGLLVTLAVLRPTRRRTSAALLALAVLWAWTGVGYHWMSFARVNPAARIFGGAFLLQAAVLVAAAVQGGVVLGAARGVRRVAGWCLAAYALLLYPVAGWLAGQSWPAMPTFGVTPCPLTLFTLGVLLLSAGVRWWLAAVPIGWAFVGGSAAFLLQVPQDWPLLVAGIGALPLLRPTQR